MILFLLVLVLSNGIYTPTDAYATFDECQTALVEMNKEEKIMYKETKKSHQHEYKCIGVPRK